MGVSSILSGQIHVLFPGLRRRCGFREIVAEQVRVSQNPVDSRVHAQIFSGLLRFNPLMSLDLKGLKFEIFLNVH
jgi:hypothetical protein